MRNITIAKTFATSTLVAVAMAALSGEAKALNEFPSKPASSLVVAGIVNGQAKIVSPAIINMFAATPAPVGSAAPPPAPPPQAPIAVGAVFGGGAGGFGGSAGGGSAGGGAGSSVKVPGAAGSSGGNTQGGNTGIGGAKNVSFVSTNGETNYGRGNVTGGAVRSQSVASVDQLIAAPLQRDFGMARQAVFNKLENRPTAGTVAGLGLATNTVSAASAGRGQALQALADARSLLE